MRKLAITLATAAALATAPVMFGHDTARAGWSDLGKFLGAMAVTAIIVQAVRAGQYHCHPGYGCHSHMAAGPYHYHDAYGRIVYQAPGGYVQPAPVQPGYVQPAPVQPGYGGGGYPAAHYDWCQSRYPNTYDPGSNSYVPTAGSPRVQCVSPYM